MRRSLMLQQAAWPGARRQSGAVLLVSLVILVVLTLLGVSTMNTTQLGEKMAANNQQMNHAFQAAETALSQAFNNSDAWEGAFTSTYEHARATFGGSTDGAEYSADFLSWTPPPVGSLYSSTTFRSAHFNFRSTGSTTDPNTGNAHLATTINGGAYQIAPKQN